MKVRFNLGRGVRYKKWKIDFEDERDPVYLDPETIQLIFKNPKLINRKSAATKIHDGANKYVCAWIKCDDVMVGNNFDVDEGTEVKYNPRVKPFWDIDGQDVDGQSFTELVSKGHRIYQKIKGK
jgi:hypothetical protein